MKKILAIHDISTMGKAGLNVVMPILSSFGNDVLPLPTCALSSITGGFGEYYKTDLSEQMWNSVKHFKRINQHFDYIYSGYLSNSEQVEIVAEIVKDNPEAIFVCDPVMADHGKLYAGYDERIIDAMNELVSIADIATPNYTEYEMLGEIKAPAFCVTSYPNKEEQPIDILCSLENVTNMLQGNYNPEPISGTGEAFTSHLIAYGIEGNSFFESCQLAMDKMQEYINILQTK